MSATADVRRAPARSRWLLATVLASGMALLDASAVNVALPAIGTELGSSLSGLQWTVTGYTLALAALVLLGGSLGDRYGRRRVFLSASPGSPSRRCCAAWRRAPVSWWRRASSRAWAGRC